MSISVLPKCPNCGSLEVVGKYSCGKYGELFCTICGWDQLDGEEFNEIADKVIEENKELLKRIGSEKRE